MSTTCPQCIQPIDISIKCNISVYFGWVASRTVGILPSYGIYLNEHSNVTGVTYSHAVFRSDICNKRWFRCGAIL